MLDAEETTQLRALQARAYGRDSTLTAADAARLVELEQRRAGAERDDARAVAAAPPIPEESRPADASRASRAQEEPAASSATAADVPAEASPAAMVVSGPDDVPRSSRSVFRRHWRALALAAMGLLLIGLAAGWALFGRDDGVPLSAAEQQRAGELEAEGEYDPGSVRAIGRDDDAIVWFGTKKAGATECIVLDVAGQSASGCQIADDLERGIGLSAGVIDARPGDEDGGEQIYASAARSHTGEMVALIQRWTLDVEQWMQQFDADERDRAEQLLDRGYEQHSLAVMGYAGDAPVWSATRTEGFTTKQCLIVDAVDASQCVDANIGMIPGEGVLVEGVSVDDSGRRSSTWSVRLDFTSMGRSYLIVQGEIPDAAEGDPTDAADAG